MRKKYMIIFFFVEKIINIIVNNFLKIGGILLVLKIVWLNLVKFLNFIWILFYEKKIL